MIKSLKRKFVLINMLLVFLVLAIVFSVLLLTTYKRLETESNELLSALLNKKVLPEDKFEFGKGPGGGMMAGNASYMVVSLDDEGNLVNVFYHNADISDAGLTELTQTITGKKADSGRISSYNVRYMRAQTADGTVIAISDCRGEKNIMANLVRLSLLSGLGGLAAFFVISLLLANMALKPTETAWNKQRRFIADASHELKTPLTVILADTDIMLSHEKETISAQKKWLLNSKDEAMRMKTLVEEMLFLAKSDDGRQSAEPSEISLSDLVLSETLAFEAVAFEKNINIKSDIADDRRITADIKQIRQLVAILLDNACKYCNEGGEVNVKVAAEGNKTLLKVKNSGSFIPVSERGAIFERFYRSDFSRARKTGGYGLGLAIAKTICEAHKAKINVLSDETGTEFTVLF